MKLVPLSIVVLSLSALIASGAHAVQTESIIDAQLFENVGVRSYVYDADQDRPIDDLWGVGVDWKEGSLSTTLDFTVLAGDDADNPGGGTELQQFLHLGVGHQGNRLAFGARYFSATDGYARSALGQQLLSQKGVFGAGDGSELWARWRAGKLNVMPRVRRSLQEVGGRLRADSHYNLAAEHPFAGGTRLRIDVAQQQQEWVGEPEAVRVDQSRVGVRLASAGWQFTVNRIDRSQRRPGDRAASQQRSATRNVAAAFRLGRYWSLRPMLAHTSSANEERRHAQLALDVATPGLPIDHLNLNVNLQDHELRAGRTSRSEVRLSGSRKLRWEGALEPTTLLSGSLLYRHRDNGSGDPAHGELGVQLTLTHTFDV